MDFIDFEAEVTQDNKMMIKRLVRSAVSTENLSARQEILQKQG